LKYRNIQIAVISLAIFSGMALNALEKPTMLSGHVVSSSLNGHGSSSESKSNRYSGRDIWWNYVISSGDLLYSVVSRDNPSKTGLNENAVLQFYEAKNWIYVPKPKGKPLSLKILNKTKIKK
jgi:hypothetical protein